MTPEREEIYGVSLTVTPVYCLESFQAGLQNRVSTQFRGVPELSRWSWESGEDKEVRVHRAEYQPGESCMERELWRGADGSPQASTRALISICM